MLAENLEFEEKNKQNKNRECLSILHFCSKMVKKKSRKRTSLERGICSQSKVSTMPTV